MRDDFLAKTRRLLSQRVGHRCSNPQCRALTSGPALDSLRAVSVGIAAHITSASPDGPRYDPALSPTERRAPENGVWLCEVCARRVDEDREGHPREVLLFWKQDAEETAHKELGLRRGASFQPLRFSSIRVADMCMWGAVRNRLRRVALWRGVQPSFGFHEIPSRNDEGKSLNTHSLDPIFEVTVINDSAQTGTVTSIGFELVVSR